jgi:transposase
VKNERPTREQLIELAKTDPEAIADLVLMLRDRVEKLEEMVAALESKVSSLESNSRSSSKPPSTDKGNFTNPPKPKSLRKKSGLKPGGQKGHQGSTLEQTDHPDHIIDHHLPEEIRCEKCAALIDTAKAEKLDTTHCECRQVFELPAIKIEVSEHRVESVFCPNCDTLNSAAFPPQVKAPVQYGQQVQAIALYLGGYQLLPYQRQAELFAEVFNCPLSPGTLANFVKRGGQKARDAMEPIRAALLMSEVAHADETGCTLNGKRHWLHVFCTAKLSCFHIDPKRGYDAMVRMGILPHYRGRLVHDCLGAYFKFEKCIHSLCNAHLQRELTYIDEEMGQSWAGDMIRLLLDAKKLIEESSPEEKISEKQRDHIWLRYCEIILEGLEKNPEPPPPPAGKRGRIKRSKPLNLLIRLEDRVEEIMGFFEYANVPWDNNQAERDLRMMKVREKISGTFRAEAHAQAFCDIRGIISSARKQSCSMLATLSALIESPKLLGKMLADGK